MTRLTFRPATQSDAVALTRLAIASKRHWGYADELIELWTNELTFTPENIDARIVTVGECGGGIAGVSTLDTTQPMAEIDAFWICPSFMGIGIGRRLFEYTLAIAAREGLDSVKIVSDPNAAGFYQHMGASFVGWQNSTPAGRRLPVYRIQTADRDALQ
jgi:GNAT superfamily N-acetyltransferase